MAFLANLFGYLLNFIYTIVNNFGVAIILFSIVVRVLLLPISIKQQRTIKKTAKIQGKIKQLQFKYKNNPEQLNKEMLELYKSEKMSPFSGCLSGIIQIILLISVFFLVQRPLTYMKKVDQSLIEQYSNEIKTESNEQQNMNDVYSEIKIISEKGSSDERVYLNMEFLGLDLSAVPISTMSDPRVYIIPILYVVSSIVSIKLSNNMTLDKKKEEEGEKEKQEEDPMAQANKSMLYIMPIMSVSISMIAPLGLALYWFISNVLMIIERITITKVLESKEEENA